MNLIQTLGTQVKKFLKGLLALSLLWLLPALGIFMFDSCNKAGYESSKQGETARKFNETLNATRTSLVSISLSNNTSQSRETESTENYYLDFPQETSPEFINDFSSDVSIQSLSDVLVNNGVSIDDSVNVNADVIIQIPEAPVRAALQPLVTNAKSYLMAKGITTQQITEMLQEENAEEIDLIPFVKTLVSIEEEQYAVRKISLPFVNEAKALPRFVECGMAALGADAIYALSQSTASSWTWGAMKKAFKTVAKKMLGPIGVAIAVVSFGICMLD